MSTVEPRKAELGLRRLDGVAPVWYRPEDPVADRVIVPALTYCEQFDCMVGFFGGGALRELSHGLAAYIHNSDRPFRLLVSPVIGQSDQQLLSESLEEARTVGLDALEAAFGDAVASESALARHAKKCLAYLFAAGRLQIRVVFVQGALFHLKEWIFQRNDDVLVLSGSANFTEAALVRNVEQLHVYRSWRNDDALFVCTAAKETFEAYWANTKPHAVSLDLPTAMAERLLQPYTTDEPPTRSEYNRAREAEGMLPLPPEPPSQVFAPPAGLIWEGGEYGHQGRAIQAWEQNGRRGVLSMATGSGKTVTALLAAWRLWCEERKLLLICAAPTRPLVSQWGREMADFGLDPYVPASNRSASHHIGKVREASQRLEFGVTDIEAVVMTHDLLKNSHLSTLLEEHAGPVLLIGDEMHNLGTTAFLDHAPQVDFSLGLSATPARQWDEEGTERLLQYFGQVVFEFGLEEAIGVCLVPYDYRLHRIELDEAEALEYAELSERLRKLYVVIGSTNAQDDDRIQLLLNRRRLVLETAHGKMPALEEILMQIGPAQLRHTLIYATDKRRESLEAVNSLLAKLGVWYHQITAEETDDARLVGAAIEQFRSGRIQVLTAMRVLDEGFNIPEIRRAIILASTTSRRQWVQRRGRVLRLAPGKDHAEIHDFLVLPPAGVPRDPDARSLVTGELERCREFSDQARNRAARDGAYGAIQDAELEYLNWGG